MKFEKIEIYIGFLKLACLFSLLFVIFLLFSVFAAADLITGLTAYYSFDSSFNDSQGNYNATAMGGVTIKSTNCFNSGCAPFDGVNDAINISSIPINASNFTLACWLNISDNDGFIFARASGVFANPYQAIANSDGNFQLFIGNGATQTPTGANPWYLHQNIWRLYIFFMSGDLDVTELYFNGNNINTSSSNTNAASDDTSKPFFLGIRADNTQFLTASFDECGMWNRNLTGAEKNVLYNSGAGCFYPWTNNCSGSSPPTISLNTGLIANTNTTANPFIFFFNATMANGANTMNNCSLYLNNSLNASQANINLSINQNFTINTTNWEKGYAINVSCFNYDNASIAANFQRLNIFFDTVIPQLTLSSNFQNNSKLFRFIDMLDFNISVQDENLFALNVTIFRITQNGSINATMNSSNATGLTGSNFTINFTGPRQIDLNLSGYTAGSYKILAQAWDSHTSKEISDYKFQEIQNGYIIEDKIKITSQDFDSLVFEKNKDRYNFNIDFKTENPEIYVECPGGISYLEKSQYPGHLVCFNERKWIDFAGTDAKINVQRVNDTVSRIMPDIKGYGGPGGKGVFTFKSIGDLNYNNMTLYFNVSNSFVFWAVDVFTNATVQNFTILINNASGLVQNKTTSSSQIYFNITAGNFTTNFSSPQYSNNNTGNLSFSDNGNFTYRVFAANSLYIFLYDEVLDTLITWVNGTIKITNFNVSSTETTTTAGTVFQSGFSPGIYELRYNAVGYNTRSYYVTISQSTTQQLELFLLNTSQATYVSFINQDETGNRYEGAYLKGLRHYTDCNCFKVIEMDLTNFNGIATLSLQQHEGKYRFLVEYLNQTVYSSTAQEGYVITADSYTLIWTLLGDTTRSFFGTTGLYKNLSYDNSSGIFYLQVNDASNLVNQFCLYVDEQNANSLQGHIQICSNCLNASSGVVSCNVSSFVANGHELIAKGWIHTSTQYSEYWLDPISIFTDIEAVTTLGVIGVFMAFLIVIVFFFGGLVLAGLHGAIIGFDAGFIIATITQLILISTPVTIGVIVISFIVLIVVGEV